MAKIQSRFSALGVDGLTTLVLSNLFLVTSFACLYGWLLVKIIRTARQTQTTAPDHSTLIVLGMRLSGDKIVSDYQDRLERAYQLYTSGTIHRILILGGPSGDGTSSEADRGRDFLLAKGVPASEVTAERKSQDTLENLRNAKDILAHEQRLAPVMITSRYHLARSNSIAQGLGLKPQLCGAEDSFSYHPRILFRLLLEAYFLHWYQVGATFSRMVKWQRGIDRIS